MKEFGQEGEPSEDGVKKTAMNGGEGGGEEGPRVHDDIDDNSKDFVVRDGFPALRLPTTESSSNVNKKQENDSFDSATTKKRNVWWVDGDEPIPRSSFWAHESCLHFDATQMPLLLQDCKTVFSARTREDGQAYSTGTTYFVPSIMKPRCALEALALEIFTRHTQHLPAGVVIPEQSGAEWWTLVLNDDDEEDDDKDGGNNNNGDKGSKMKVDSSSVVKKDGTIVDDADEEEEEEDDDEVGLHFDADYGLEDQVPNLLLHPRVATVTYLTNAGAPTVVLDCRSPHSQPHQYQQQPQSAQAANVAQKPKNGDNDDDDDDAMMRLHGANVRKAWLSHPKVGKHVAFDGRLLHGAPATFFPPTATTATRLSAAQNNHLRDRDDADQVEPAAKKPKLSNGDDDDGHHHQQPEKQQRITFLLNIWVNHCPLDAEPLEDEICAQLKTPCEWSSPPSPSPPPKPNEKQPQSDSGEEPSSTKEVVDVKVSNTTAKAATPVFTWNKEALLDKPPAMESVKLQKWSSIQDDRHVEPAGEEEVVICERLVTVKYESSLQDLHKAAAASSLVEMDFEEGALVIEVGDKVEAEEEEQDADDEDEDGDDRKQAATNEET